MPIKHKIIVIRRLPTDFEENKVEQGLMKQERFGLKQKKGRGTNEILAKEDTGSRDAKGHKQQEWQNAVQEVKMHNNRSESQGQEGLYD